MDKTIKQVFNTRWNNLIKPLLEDKGINNPQIITIYPQSALISARMKDGVTLSNIQYIIDTNANIIFTVFWSEMVEVVTDAMRDIYGLLDSDTGYLVTNLAKGNHDVRFIGSDGIFIKTVDVVI